jgi:predicted transglutaminase-like cysteine proteinase
MGIKIGNKPARLGLALLVAAAAAGCAADMPSASIAPYNGLFRATPDIDTASGLPIGAPLPPSADAAIVPPGFIGFCVRFTDQCMPHPGEASRLALTAQNWTLIRKINAEVNAAIRPMDDEAHYGRAEYWTIPTDGYGDCEDYALTKRKLLTEAGLPAPALRIAVVETPRETRHAVLTVVTDRGDFVLDNIYPDVVSWNIAGYRWVSRQDAAAPYHWVGVDTAPQRIAANGAPPTSQPTEAIVPAVRK